jgi:hypothetical protein
VDDIVLCRAAPPGIASVGILTENVAVYRGRTYKKPLPHILQPASVMTGFPPPSIRDCKNEYTALGMSSY